MAHISKTYAPGGTSPPKTRGLRPAVHDAQEHPMLDIVMLALGPIVEHLAMNANTLF